MNLSNRKYSYTFWVSIVAFALTAFAQAGLSVPSYTNEVALAILNCAVVIGILSDTSKAGFGFNIVNLKKSIQNPVVVFSITGLIVLIGQRSGLYDVPANVQALVETIVNMLVFLGIMVNPETQGLDD